MHTEYIETVHRRFFFYNHYSLSYLSDRTTILCPSPSPGPNNSKCPALSFCLNSHGLKAHVSSINSFCFLFIFLSPFLHIFCCFHLTSLFLSEHMEVATKLLQLSIITPAFSCHSTTYLVSDTVSSATASDFRLEHVCC